MRERSLGDVGGRQGAPTETTPPILPKGARAVTRVTVLGLGYIGLPTAAMLALHGSDVTGFDVQGALVQALESGNIPVRERDLSAIVRDALSTGHLRVSDRLERAAGYIICVPT